MADGGKPPTPEKKSWADVEEEEEAKAKAAAAAEAASSSSSNEPAVDAQAKQIEALSLSVPEEHGGSGGGGDDQGPPLLDDSDESQIQAVSSASALVLGGQSRWSRELLSRVVWLTGRLISRCSCSGDLGRHGVRVGGGLRGSEADAGAAQGAPRRDGVQPAE